MKNILSTHVTTTGLTIFVSSAYQPPDEVSKLVDLIHKRFPDFKLALKAGDNRNNSLFFSFEKSIDNQLEPLVEYLSTL